MKKLLWSAFIVFAGCTANSNMNKSVVDDSQKTLFTVDGSPVSVQEFVYVYKKNNVNNDSAFTEKDIDEYFDLYVKFKLKIKEAMSLGMDTTKSFRNEFNTYKDQLKKPYLTETKVTDSLMKEAYQRFQHEVNASHILVKLEENASPEDTLNAFNKITGIRQRALAGEDFATLAREYSDDSSAKSNGGNLGYFTSFQMVYPFESAAYSTSPGKVSKPARTRFGYHIVKVLDKRAAQGNVEVSHIMVRITPGSQDSTAARNKIFEIHEQATGGVPWNELASQFSEDINSKDKGGRLRPFSVGQLPYPFQEAAFALKSPGDISDPVMTPYGWHIIRLEGKTPLKSFEEMEATIKSRINRDSRADLNRKAFISRLKKENGFSEEPAMGDVLSKYTDSTLVEGKWSAPELTEVENQVVFRVNDTAYNLKDFFGYVEGKQKKNSNTPKQYIEILYENFKEDRIAAYEEDHLEDKYLDYRMLVKEYREGILLFQLMEDEVWSRAAEDTVGLQNFFHDNIASYQWGERVRATIYNASNTEVLSGIRDLLANEPDLTEKELKDRFNKESSLTLQIDEGYFEKGDQQAIDKIEWNPGQHEVDVDNRKALVIVHEVLASGPKKLNETKGLVISDYQNELEKKWVDQLRDRYPVVINESGLRYVYESLL